MMVVVLFAEVMPINNHMMDAIPAISPMEAASLCHFHSAMKEQTCASA